MPHTISTLTVAEYQALVNGIPKYCPNAVFAAAGQVFTAAQAVTFISSVLATVSAVETAKTGWTDARLAEEVTVAKDGPIVKVIRDAIAAQFSNSTTTLAAFDIQPKKPRQPLSAEARAAATAKAKATRAARGTTSKKHKEAITGNVVGVTITPVTAPSSTPSATSTTSTTVTAPTATTTPVSAAPAVGSTVTTSTSVATPAAPSTTAPAVSNGTTPTPSGTAHA